MHIQAEYHQYIQYSYQYFAASAAIVVLKCFEISSARVSFNERLNAIPKSDRDVSRFDGVPGVRQWGGAASCA